MNYKLLNYDHGNKYPESLSIGPFTIEITKQHCLNLIKLPRNKCVTFGFDSDFNRVIKNSPKISGGWIETAEVTINDKDIGPSVIFPETDQQTNIDDLCLLLSFTSGRVVSLHDDPFIGQLNPEEHTDKVVHYGYFSRNKFNWNNLSVLRNQGLAGQFYNLTMAYQSQDYVARAVHFNNALNVAYDKWNEQNPIRRINKKLRSQIRSNILEVLKGNIIEEETINDISNNIHNIFSPSATLKLKHFLRGIDLYPNPDLPEMHERLKWLILVRNSMAHTGILPSNNKISDDLVGEATLSVIELILRINQYYFGKQLLKLDDPYLGFIRGLILPYFHEGKMDGKLVFTEKHEEYMSRATKAWETQYS